MKTRPVFPFTAIVGQEQMKKALILNAVNPSISGVLIRGHKGTAKSTAVRALASLLPEIEVVPDCPFNCHPAERELMCPRCRESAEDAEEMPAVSRRMRVVELPLGATEERVVGTFNLEEAIQKGERRFEPGVLAAANRGILYVDEINLLEDHLVDVLLDAAAMGVNVVEREGISFTHPARFILVGTMNPEEGELRPQLLDRFGLCVEVTGSEDAEERVQVIDRRLRFEADPEGFCGAWKDKEESLASRIVSAREGLDRVTCPRELMRLAAEVAVEMGTQGHRADITMVKTARTIAAYAGREEVSRDDIREAADLVLPHRMRRKPFEEPRAQRDDVAQAFQKHSQQDGRHEGEPPEQRAVPPEDDGSGEEEKQETPGEETVFEPGQTHGVQNISPPPERKVRKGAGRRSKARSDSRNGRYVRSRMPSKDSPGDDVALDATLRAAAPYQRWRNAGDGPVSIRKEDIREKVRQKKVRNTIVFVVDSSGSMGAKQRMVAVKGAIISLLEDAYQKRDHIGLVAFKGDDAEVLLPPTSSVELAKERLEELPTGGKTPFSKGLWKGYQVLRGEIAKDEKIQPLLIVVSDGRANVSMGQNAEAFHEATHIAEKIKNDGIRSVVIDTESGMVQLGGMKKLGEALGGRYCRLEEVRADHISEAARSHLGEIASEEG